MFPFERNAIYGSFELHELRSIRFQWNSLADPGQQISVYTFLFSAAT